MVIPLIATTALAHPGGTDSSGGHTDSDTGDYHYHHGYPAHEHTDSDGDGYRECPYRPDWEERQARQESHISPWRTEYTALILMLIFCILAHLFAYLANYCSRTRKDRLRRILDVLWVTLAILSFFFSFMMAGLLHHLRTMNIQISKPPPAPPLFQNKESLSGTVFLNHSRAQHQKYCLFLWRKSVAFLKASGIPCTNSNCAKTFAAFFYTSVKTIRSQDFADEVYHLLPIVLRELVGEKPDKSETIGSILVNYRKIAPELNESSIDPLTPEGADDLWNFLLSRLRFEDSCNETAKGLFLDVVSSVVRSAVSFKDNANPYYPPKLNPPNP